VSESHGQNLAKDSTSMPLERASQLISAVSKVQ
jgi:hypothetical protein